MRQRALRGIAAASLGAVLTVGLWVGPVRAAGPQAATDAGAIPARFNGRWRLNKDLSSPVPDEASAEAGGRTGRSGRPPGGGGMGGGRSGGLGGFGRGGGSGGGNYGGGGSRSAASSEDTLKLHAIRREFSEMPDGLTIVVSSSQVVLTSDEGRVRKFTTDGKKQELDLVTAKVDVTSTWDQNVLRQEWSAGHAKFAVTYQLTSPGKLFAISIEPEHDKNDPGAAVGGDLRAKYVYERVETGGGGLSTF